MENIINIANPIIVYSVCYTLIFVVYGYVFYHVFKFIAQIVIYAYKKLAQIGVNGALVNNIKQAAGRNTTSLPLVL